MRIMAADPVRGNLDFRNFAIRPFNSPKAKHPVFQLLELSDLHRFNFRFDWSEDP
jgi:hypothetical protein